MNANSTSTDRYLTQFGSGLCYSLALFLTHEANVKYTLAEVELMAAEGALSLESGSQIDDSWRRTTIERLAAVRWFAHAVNPLRNLVIPEMLARPLRVRLSGLRSNCQAWSLPSSQDRPTLADVRWALEEARELIRLVDEFHGIRTAVEDPIISRRREPALILRDDHDPQLSGSKQ